VEVARDPEILQLMKQTDCFAVYVGLESVNPKTLELYNKSQSVDEITRAIEAFHKYDIHIHGMFVFGSDEDDVQSIFHNVEFAKKMKIDSVQFLILTPLPGTSVYNELDRAGRLFNHNWSYYDGHNVVYEPARMTAYELQVETFKAMNKFYTYPSIMRYLLRLDKYYALVRIYAKYMVHKGMRTKKIYAKHLRELLSNKMNYFSKKVKHLKSPLKIGIPSISVDRWQRDFFKSFFRQLGVNVIFSPGKCGEPKEGQSLVDVLQRQIQIVQKKADVIVVPVVDKVNERLEDFSRAKNQILSSLDSGVLVLKSDIDALYKSCVEVGFALGKNIGSIRKAYTRAVRHVGYLPAAT
jgi:hypothetical protein